MKKPSQPRDTRHTRDSRPASQTWTPANFRKEDWDFRDCREDEIFTCYSYEFSRHSAELVSNVLQARKAAKENTFDALYRQSQAGFTGEELPGLRDYPLFALCPEWPKDSYLSIPRLERKARIEKVEGWVDGKPPCGEGWIVEDITQHATFERKYGQFECCGTIQSHLDPWQWSVALAIDWRLHDQTMLDSLKDWLKNNRPVEFKNAVKTGHTGSGSPINQRKADLKALGAFRLVQKYGDWFKAADAIFNETEGEFIAHADSAWTRAKTRAAKIIEGPTLGIMRESNG